MNRDRGLEQTILLQDLSVVVVSLVLSAVLRQNFVAAVPGLQPAVPLRQYLHLVLVFVPAWALCAERVQLHRVRTLAGPTVELLRALVITQAWGALAIALILVAAQVQLNRSLIATFLLVSTVLLSLAKIAQRRSLVHSHGQALALVMGLLDAETGNELYWIRGRRLEALQADDAAALRRRLQEGGVDEVVLPGRLPPEALRALLEACDEIGVPALLPMPAFDLGRHPPRAEVLGRTVFLTYQTQEPGAPALFVKTLLDRIGSAVLVFLCAPLFVLVAIAIKLGSKGPVLFVQERGGVNGRPFRMLKFRTMREGAEAERAALLAANEMDGPVFKIARDPRVTGVGAWLRRTSLDELPQLWNALVGDMSLVGPRPLPLVETRQLVGPHRRRLSMKPGITGLWQVSGRNELGFEAWMALDLQYVDHWSLGLDLAILLRTLPALLTARGAR